MITLARTRVSEFTSYIYIKKELSDIGWNTRNPARNSSGEVYTQQECLDNTEIQKQLGKEKPEYVVKISEDKYYVIEAKAKIEDLEKAYEEAKEYAIKINQNSIISAPIISGVAGNDEDGYLVKSAYLENQDYKLINYRGREITSLVSKDLAHQLVFKNSASIPELKVDEKSLLKVAESINEILHGASINKDERAAVMSTILLSMVDDTQPNYNASPTVFVKDINNRAENVLIGNNKKEFFKHIEIKLPSTDDAQIKYKEALVSTMFFLKKINIKAAMNSGSDVLGQFYEVFLKYGNGAKDIGIVLTPRHITKYVANILNITHKDIVYDPTCGTGGFLVSAFDYVRNTATYEQVEDFRKHNIFGIEQQPKVAALAIVNMIFRGDGRNNIIDNDCLSRSLKSIQINGENSAEYVSKMDSQGKKPITKVLMNPPFALKNNDEKEYKFVQHALDQMEDGGLLFSVLPLSVMLKGGGYKAWRENQLLNSNTLLAVITFPEDLFYPVGVNTCGIFVKKGFKHSPEQNVLWVKILNDGYLKSKGKRLPSSRVSNDLDAVKQILKMFIQDQKTSVENIPKFIKSCPINFEDSSLELTPEVYLDSDVPSLEELSENMEGMLREYVGFLIRNRKENDINDQN